MQNLACEYVVFAFQKSSFFSKNVSLHFTINFGNDVEDNKGPRYPL